jgi:hypothetical protein
MRAVFEEGTELFEDIETVALATGWTEEPAESCDLFRDGTQVTLSLRIKNVSKANPLICTLPPAYRPVANCLDPTGKIECKTNGEVISKRTTVELETSTAAVFANTYRSAQVSP